MESALSQSGAQHLRGNHRPLCEAGRRVHPWEVQCPQGPGLLLTPVMDSPQGLLGATMFSAWTLPWCSELHLALGVPQRPHH